MPPPASPDTGSKAVPPLTTTAEPAPQSPPASPPPADAPHITPHHPAVQEILQQYVHERLKALELRLSLEQRRHRDQVEEELHKMQQQLTATAREQHQYQQNVSAALRETLEHMRKEFSEALTHIAQDMTQALRQTEERMKHACENLRDEMQQLLLNCDQLTTRGQGLGNDRTAPGKPAPQADAERRP
jgi:flagellar biosynthesis/type III secretory pathway protein FliH